MVLLFILFILLSICDARSFKLIVVVNVVDDGFSSSSFVFDMHRMMSEDLDKRRLPLYGKMKAIECGISSIAATSKREIPMAREEKREELAMQIAREKIKGIPMGSKRVGIYTI